VRRSSSRERKPLPKGFGTIWTTVAIDLIGFGIVLPILPQYARRFGATPAMIGVLVASFSMAQLAFAPIWGRLSDRIGRKPVLLISLFGTALGSLLTGVAGGLALLFIGRIIDGASGASVSVAQASVADVAEPQDRARLMGLLGAAFGVGFVAGPAIGAVGAHFGPSVPFYLAAAIAFVNALIAIRRLPETSPVRRFPRAEREPDSTSSPDFTSFLRRSEPEIRPLVPQEREGSAEIIRLITVSFIGMIAFSGFEATFSLLTSSRFGLTLSATGVVFTVIGIALVAVQVGLVGRVNDRLGESSTLRLGLVLNAGGLGLLAVPGGWATLVPALMLLVVGQGLITPTLSSAVAGRAGRDRGRWLGWQQSAGGLARVLGPITAGVLFGIRVGAPYAVGAVLALIALSLVPTTSVTDTTSPVHQ
jgi:DHA1 family tetracycline resistance protein-like MFS transporter